MSISYIPMVVGFAYICGGLHMALDARLSKSTDNLSK
jgi:hypothetical protein